jgi:hypothetical protein
MRKITIGHNVAFVFHLIAFRKRVLGSANTPPRAHDKILHETLCQLPFHAGIFAVRVGFADFELHAGGQLAV